ncbi:MAG: DNA-3-methyladenine glycosylase [Gemmatimonadales bacterium]
MTGNVRAAEELPVSFFARQAGSVARDLLGKVLVSVVGGRRVAGRIVETEAYLGRDDPASHAWQMRRNARNGALYGPPGSWYVYLSYGIHWCANLVCNPEGIGAAVLLRAAEPLEGLEVMRRRRGGQPDRLLCAGPGRLCQAFGITRRLDSRAMDRSPVRILVAPGLPRRAIEVSTRVGITRAADRPLRFSVRDSPWVSAGRGRG